MKNIIILLVVLILVGAGLFAAFKVRNAALASAAEYRNPVDETGVGHNGAPADTIVQRGIISG